MFGQHAANFNEEEFKFWRVSDTLRETLTSSIHITVFPAVIIDAKVDEFNKLSMFITFNEKRVKKIYDIMLQLKMTFLYMTIQCPGTS